MCEHYIQGHGCVSHRVSKLEPEGEHSGVPGVQRVLHPFGEPACPHCEMQARPGVGGHILPICGPQAAGLGDSMHGIGALARGAAAQTLPGLGGLVLMERIRSCT